MVENKVTCNDILHFIRDCNSRRTSTAINVNPVKLVPYQLSEFSVNIS